MTEGIREATPGGVVTQDGRELAFDAILLVEVGRTAHDAHFAQVNKRQRNTVFFHHACGASNSYDFDEHGDALFRRPASGMETYLQSCHFSPSHDEFRRARGLPDMPRKRIVRSELSPPLTIRLSPLGDA